MVNRWQLVSWIKLPCSSGKLFQEEGLRVNWQLNQDSSMEEIWRSEFESRFRFKFFSWYMIMSNFCLIFFQVSAFHEVRHLVPPWLLRSYSSPPTVRCPLVNFLWLRKSPYHLNCLLWILSKIDCSACILLLMVVVGIFCNMDSLADLLK